ncbi:GAF domain-containing protein [Luteimicrobium album]|uniref:GAF domain-containing protein n=1 Tax=Luteimicrobium album TaxID=1054550 RepID=UPI0024E0B307|nr:GAF domain-containing protein [Luteimicrobium album]
MADTAPSAHAEPLGSDATQRLVDALVAITSPLDLDTILARIVEGAMTMTGARYGALGVYDGTRLERFLPHGLTEDEIARIDHWPHGEGLLGLVMDEARPVRADDIARDPRAAGLPAGHPPMTTFLGVPITVRDTVYGNLYLTDKAGGAPFGAEDESVVVAFASAAGATIENARLHHRAREAAVADDRERIARDLHDVVVQRLFAAGLGLMSVVPRLSDDVRAVVEATVTDLDETISEIRTTISDLRSNPSKDALPSPSASRTSPRPRAASWASRPG